MPLPLVFAAVSLLLAISSCFFGANAKLISLVLSICRIDHIPFSSIQTIASILHTFTNFSFHESTCNFTPAHTHTYIAFQFEINVVHCEHFQLNRTKHKFYTHTHTHMIRERKREKQSFVLIWNGIDVWQRMRTIEKE